MCTCQQPNCSDPRPTQPAAGMTYLTDADLESLLEHYRAEDDLVTRIEVIAARVAAETRESVLDEVERILSDPMVPIIPMARQILVGAVRDLRGGEDRG